MQSDFTQYNQEDTFEYFSIDDVEDAAQYLTDPSSFRSFNEGLTELLIKKGILKIKTTQQNYRNILSPN